MDLDLLIILDRSGSMQSAKADHEGGFRSFLEDQRTLDGDVRLTLVQFDSVNPCEVLYNRTPLTDVTNISLVPRGGTPLLDAVGRAVSHLRAQIPASAPVVALVITDGEDNASTEWTKARVRALVTELEAQAWSFLFLGANVDAFAEAGALGIGTAAAVGYTQNSASIGAVYAYSAMNLLQARVDLATGVDVVTARQHFTYTAAQRAVISGGSDGLVSRGGDSDPDQKAEG